MSNEVNLSPANQAYLNRVLAPQSNSTELTQEKVKEKKNGKKLLAYGAMALAAIGVASVAIYKHKNPVKAIENIDLKKGIARFKGKNYTGKAIKKLPCGDVTLEYVDGILKKSTKKGANGFIKEYSTNEAGEKLVKITRDGKTETRNITQASKDVKARLEKQKLEAEKIAKEQAEKLAKEKALKKSFSLFKDGIALNKEGKPFTGTIEKTLKNGDNVAIEYSDGILVKSTKSGEHGFIKEYSTNEKGEKLVKITRDGKTETRNITQGSKDIKARLEKQKLEKEKLAKEKADKLAKEQAEKIVKEQESMLSDIFLKEGYSQEESQKLARLYKNTQLGEEILRNKGFATCNGEVAIGHSGAYSYNHILHRETSELPIEAELLDIAFKHLKPISEPITVYRGYQGGVLSSYQTFINNLRAKNIGDTFVDKGFAYSSFKKNIAESFQGDNGVIFTINVPKGAKVSRTKWSEQAECLFPRNAKFKIVDKIQDGNITNFIVNYILPD